MKLGRLLVAGFASLAAAATTRRIASSRSVLYFVLLFASNLFYPLEPLPKWFRGAALANPITWQIDCLRWATIGAGNAHRVALESIAFIVFAVAGFLYAARCLQRQQYLAMWIPRRICRHGFQRRACRVGLKRR